MNEEDRAAIQAAIEQRREFNAKQRERFADLLAGPHGETVDRILHHIEPYVGLEVAAMPEHLLASDILILLGLLDRATSGAVP